MRHLKQTAKLGRTGEHRNAMLANLVCSLIRHRRVTTTLAKAKATRPVAEKMVTLAKRGSVHDRRLASARLRQDEDAVRILFDDIAPTHKDRNGGYTRIIKLHRRRGDAAEQAILEWVEAPLEVGTPKPASEKKSKAKPEAETAAPADSSAETEEVKAEAKPVAQGEAETPEPETERADGKNKNDPEAKKE